MESREFWFMLITVIVFCLGNDATMTNRSCEGSLLALTCPNNNTINVISANYGRTSSLYCPGTNSERVTNCIQDMSLEIVRGYCQGKVKCSIFATNSVFLDPCPGILKYLEVNFTCEELSCNTLNCNKTSEVCVEGSNGVICKCAENYVGDENGKCQAATCHNSANNCDPISERCQDNSSGIECVCAEAYIRDTTNQCVEATCQNSANNCDPISERCQDSSSGIECVCAEAYIRDKTNKCVAATCQNSVNNCDPISERCQDISSGIECICAEGFIRDTTNQCVVPECFSDEDVRCTQIDVKKAVDELDVVNVTSKTAVNVAEKLFNLSTESDLISGENIDSLTDIVVKVVDIQPQAEVGEVTKFVIGIINNMYNVDSQSIGESTTVGALPEALETQLGNAASTSRNFAEIMLPNVRGVAAPVNQESLKECISFGSSFLGNTSREKPTELTHFSPPTIRAGASSSENLSSYIELPSSIGDKLTAGVNSSVPLSFVIYKNATIFPLPPESIRENGTTVRQVISSQIISASVANMLVENLPNNERVMSKFFSFPVASRCEKEEKHECVFWKYNNNIGKGEWSNQGCETSGMSEERHVTCLCNHLTSFAVLVHVAKESRPVALDVITYIGCVLSIIGLFICVITVLTMKSLREKQPSQVHLNLCITLIAFYLTFLIGIDGSGNPLGCRITAFFIHFFCLSSTAFMCLEAVLLYNLIVKLRRTDIKYLLPVGMIFAWGVPLLAAIAVAILDKSHDYGCFPDYCFLHPGLAMYLGFILLIVLMSVFNLAIFIMVSWKFACRPITATDDEKRRKQKAFRIRGIILFWLLMGMSWIFGLLAAIPSPVEILFDIIFSILMALQGFAMFYLLTVTNPEVKKLLERFNCFGENMYPLSWGRSTTIPTQGAQKSHCNDQSGQPQSVVTDTQKLSSQPQTDNTPT